MNRNKYDTGLTGRHVGKVGPLDPDAATASTQHQHERKR